jgi:hypothetical protein
MYARGFVTRNTKAVWLTGAGVLVLVVSIVVGRDLFLRRQKTFDCGDGQRRSIDIRDFTTQYSAYSWELEASFKDTAKISAKINPVQLQQLSESVQNARDFRQYVVAGYNSCALTKAQYGQYGAKFQALDNLAREINELLAQPSPSTDAKTKLGSLITEYGVLSRKLATE